MSTISHERKPLWSINRQPLKRESICKDPYLSYPCLQSMNVELGMVRHQIKIPAVPGHFRDYAVQVKNIVLKPLYGTEILGPTGSQWLQMTGASVQSHIVHVNFAQTLI